MKNYTDLFIFLFLFFGSIHITAQDVISNVVSEGNEQRHILQEHEGKSYIVKISSLDSLFTYRFEDEALVLQHTNYVIGSYTDFYQFHTGKWLFYAVADGALAYDFINDTFTMFDYEDDLSHSSWRLYGNGVISLKQSSEDFSDQTNYLLDDDLNILDISDGISNLVKVSESYYLFRESDENGYTYFKQDRITGELSESIAVANDIRNTYDEKVLLYYNEISGELIMYDFETGEEELIFTVNDSLTRYEVSQTEDQMYFSGSNYDSDIYYSVVINKHNRKVKFLDRATLDSDYKSMKDIVIYDTAENENKLHLYNFSTDEFTFVNAYSRADDILIIDDRYMLYSNWLEQYVYDSQSESITEFFIQIPFNYRLRIAEMKIGNKHYVDLGSDIEFIEDMLVFDEEDKTVEHSNIVPKSSRGLIERTSINRLGNDIFVLNDEHLYVIKDDELQQLDEYEIIENNHFSHKIDGNGLLWAEKNEDHFTFYKYYDGEKKVLTSFLDENDIDLYNLNVSSFIDGDNTILINGRSGFEQVVKLISKSDNTEITSFDDPLESLGISFFFEGHYYYSTSSYFNRIDEAGNKVDLDFEPSIIGFGSSIKHDGKLFLKNDTKIARIENGELIDEYEFEDQEGFISSFDIWNGYLILDLYDDILIYKDEVWKGLDINLDYWYTPFFESYLQAIEGTGTNQTYTRLYDLDSEEYIELPDEINTQRLVSGFTYNEEQYLIASDGFFPNVRVKVYKMTNHFADSEEVTSFESTGRGLNGLFKPYGDEGLLYIGNRLFLMNDQLKFIPLNTVNGDNNSIYIEEEEGTFYFIAIHPEKGRQVFSVVAFSERVSTDNYEFSDIKIFPNPAQDILKWTSDLPENKIQNVDIYNLHGQWMMTSNNENVNISELNTGVYVAIFSSKSGEHLGSYEFIKVK